MYVGNVNHSVPTPQDNARPSAARGSGGGDAVSAGGADSRTAADADASVVVASDVADLLEHLQRIPEIRAGVVARVSERLGRGEYSTREAAVQTAAALLGAG